MKALIALNGDCPDPEFLIKLSIGRALIAADGGYEHYLSTGLKPCVIVGDMDSIERIPPGTEILRYSPDKDRTDCQLAMDAAIERGAEEIVLTCALSRDMGHVFENIRSLLLSPVPARIEEPEMSIFAMKEGEAMEVEKGKKVSVVPMGESADVILEGFRYSMEGTIREKSGVSNISVEKASITVKRGYLAVFIYR